MTETPRGDDAHSQHDWWTAPDPTSSAADGEPAPVSDWLTVGPEDAAPAETGGDPRASRWRRLVPALGIVLAGLVTGGAIAHAVSGASPFASTARAAGPAASGYDPSGSDPSGSDPSGSDSSASGSAGSDSSGALDSHADGSAVGPQAAVPGPDGGRSDGDDDSEGWSRSERDEDGDAAKGSGDGGGAQGFRSGLAGEQRLVATVTAVSGTSVTVRTAGGTATYTVDATTEVVVDGQRAALDAVHVGDLALLHVYPASSGRALRVERILVRTPSNAPGFDRQDGGTINRSTVSTV